MKNISIYLLNICFLVSCKGLSPKDSSLSISNAGSKIEFSIVNIDIESASIEFEMNNESDTNYWINTSGLTWKLAIKDALNPDQWIKRVGYIERIYPINIDKFILLKSGETRTIKIMSRFFTQFELQRHHAYVLSSKYYNVEESFSGQQALTGEIAISPYEFIYH